MKKRLFSILLCLALALALLPASVSAVTVVNEVDLSLETPVAGQYPPGTATWNGSGYAIYAIDWYDCTEDRYLESDELIQENHQYRATLWVEADSGYEFNCENDNVPGITAYVNGQKVEAYKAFEYKAWAMVCMDYYFPNIGSTEPEHTHTASDWRTTQVYHYKVCTTCGDFLEQEDHYGGVSSCAEPMVCAACNYAYREAHENHTPDTSKWVARAELYHFHKCIYCGAHCDIEDHLWSPRYHAVDARGHAYQCADCMGYDTIHPHNPGPAATESSPQTCKDCGYIIAPPKNHTHTLTAVAEVAPTCMDPGVNAYYSCSGCSQLFRDAAGTDAYASNEELVIPPQGHQISNGWEFNEVTHWRTCAVCSEKMIETDMEHELLDGKCTTCEFSSTPATEPSSETTEATTESTETTEPTEVTEPTEAAKPQKNEKDGLPWWALVLIALGAVCVGVGGGVLLLNMSKKKR